MTGFNSIRLPVSPQGRRYQGFSMIEMAVALVVIGLLVSASGAYLGVFGSGDKFGANARLVSLSESVIAFAGARNRLPCPDTAGAGYEAGTPCPANVQVGWFPYLSMGLSQPPALERAIYGVYRNPAVAADLAVVTGPGFPATVPVSLLTKLNAAAAQGASNNFVYLTGDGTAANGAENCVGNNTGNAAFVILVPGEDRNRDGQRVDGINSTPPAAGLCFSAPTRAWDTNFDDRTLAVSSYAVLARLNQ